MIRVKACQAREMCSLYLQDPIRRCKPPRRSKMGADMDTKDTALQVFGLCAACKLRSGDALPLQAFWHRGVQQRLTGSDVADGVTKGVELGWYERISDDTYLLTDAGFTAM